MFTDLSLCLDNTFLIGSHNEGIISVINLEESTSNIIERPIGDVDNIWGVEVYNYAREGDNQTVFVPSSNGIFQCVITPHGQFIYCMESFYEGQNVTNCMLINEDEMLVSLPTKLVILNLDTRQEKILIQADSGAAYFIDMCKIPTNPGEPDYFIVHTGKGIQLVNTGKRRCYDLVIDQ